jgi:hypothetical protein
VKRDAGQDAPVDPRPAITIEPQPAPEPEPLSDGPGVDSAGTAEDSVPEEPGDGAGPAPAVVGPGDAGALLERGRASANRRARDLAGSLDRYLAELAGILDADEKTREVRGQIAELEEALAAKRRELAALLPDKAAVRVAAAEDSPKMVVVGGVEVDRRLYYSEAVRSWAREHGHEVGSAGKMPRAVVEAYVAAHPAA